MLTMIIMTIGILLMLVVVNMAVLPCVVCPVGSTEGFVCSDTSTRYHNKACLTLAALAETIVLGVPQQWCGCPNT